MHSHQLSSGFLSTGACRDSIFDWHAALEFGSSSRMVRVYFFRRFTYTWNQRRPKSRPRIDQQPANIFNAPSDMSTDPTMNLDFASFFVSRIVRIIVERRTDRHVCKRIIYVTKKIPLFASCSLPHISNFTKPCTLAIFVCVLDRIQIRKSCR